MIFSIAMLVSRRSGAHFFQMENASTPLKLQVLMSGIEVDGWQLFLKEAMSGGGAGQLCWDFFLPNLDLCQNSVLFYVFRGRFSEFLEFVPEFLSNFGKFIGGPNFSQNKQV